MASSKPILTFCVADGFLWAEETFLCDFELRLRMPFITILEEGDFYDGNITIELSYRYPDNSRKHDRPECCIKSLFICSHFWPKFLEFHFSNKHKYASSTSAKTQIMISSFWKTYSRSGTATLQSTPSPSPTHTISRFHSKIFLLPESSAHSWPTNHRTNPTPSCCLSPPRCIPPIVCLDLIIPAGLHPSLRTAESPTQ